MARAYQEHDQISLPFRNNAKSNIYILLLFLWESNLYFISLVFVEWLSTKGPIFKKSYDELRRLMKKSDLRRT